MKDLLKNELSIDGKIETTKKYTGSAYNAVAVFKILELSKSNIIL